MALVTRICRVVAQCYGVSFDDLVGPWRPKSTARARFAVYRLLKGELNYSYPLIGRLLGKHHTSCLSGYERSGVLAAFDPEWLTRYQRALALLRATP